MASVVNISHLSKITWSHLSIIVRAVKSSAERDFYLAVAARDHWTVRELRQQIAQATQLNQPLDFKSQILQFTDHRPSNQSPSKRETNERTS